MASLIPRPTVITAAGNKPKLIEEFVGRVNSKTADVSVARMKSPEGWVEPKQTPEFDEYTLVLKGTLRVDFQEGSLDVKEGQAVVAPKDAWVRYGSPDPGGAEYVAVCLPAFSPATVHREGDPEVPETDEERKRKHIDMYKKLGRVFMWSGWVVAFVALALGSHLLNAFHKRTLELQARLNGLETATPHDLPPQSGNE
jgi:mannose-6-phosphate isomerase-like protein (cupin superfamily)